MKRKAGFLLWPAVLTGMIVLIFLRKRGQKGMEDRTSPVPGQGLYRFWAPVYDLLFGATYKRARQRTVYLLELKPGERLLIPGVGTGLDLPLVPEGVQVTGVDISLEMLQLAARKPSQAGVELVQMDAQRLELPSKSFDAALLNLIVSVAPDGRAVFQEAWRALKPGGRLVLFDKFLPEGQAVGFLRRTLGMFFLWIGTDINRRLCDVIGEVENAHIEVNEPSLFFGQYRILKLRKSVSDAYAED